MVFGVVTANFENFGNESLPWPTLQLDKDVQRIGDIALDRAIRQLNSALENTTSKTRGVCCDY